MDFETSDMELEIKDEVKEEIIDEILKEAQEAIENANLELKTEDGIGTEDLLCPSPPPTSAVELNAVETEFDGRPEKGPRNSISKARLICPHCPKSFPTSKALEKHSLNLHGTEHDKRVELSCGTWAGRKFNDQKSRDEHIKEYHINNVSAILSRDRSLVEFPRCAKFFEVEKDLNTHVPRKDSDLLEIGPLATATPSVGTKIQQKNLTVRHECPHCDETFAQKSQLNQHMRKFYLEPKPRVRCPHCPLTFLLSQKRTFRSHMKKLHNEDCHLKSKSIKKCSQGAETFYLKSKLTANIETVCGEGEKASRIKCQVQSEHTDPLEVDPFAITTPPAHTKTRLKIFPTSKSLKEHTLNLPTVKNDKSVEFRCVTCAGRNFIDQKSLDEHIKQYHIANVSVLLSRDISLLECTHCPRLFLVQKDLNAHVESEHTDLLEIDPLSTITPPVGTETTLEISTTRQKHKCPHCSFAFLLSQSLQEHIIKIHVKHKAFPCHICANLKRSKVQSFIDQQSLDQHIKSCHAHVREGKPALKTLPKCPHCDKTFSQESHFTAHIKTVHAEPQERASVKCPHCPSTFSRDFNLRQHIIKCHVKHIGFPCNICASLKKPQVKSFISQKILDLHLRRCHGHVPEKEPAEFRLKCPQCEKTYSQKSHLADHIKDIHNGTGLWEQCPQCPLFFTCNEALKRHLISWHKEPCENNEIEMEPGSESLQKCPHCDITLSGKSSLAVHIELVHTESQPRIKCPHCDKIFSQKCFLTGHIKRLHSGPRLRVQCPQCPSTFARNQSLEYHIRNSHKKEGRATHGNETEPGVTRHINRLHSEPRARIQCPQCPSTFSCNSSLKLHTSNRHNGSKAFPCLTCKSRKTSRFPVFASQEKLNYHMQLNHDPASLKRCPRCNKGFPRNRSTDLKYHMLVYHLNIPRSDLKNHLRDPKYTLENLLKEQTLEKQQDPNTVKTQKIEMKTQKTNCRYCNKIFLNTQELRHHVIQIHVKQKKPAEKEDLPNSPIEQDGDCGKEIGIKETSDKIQCLPPPPRVQCPKCPSTFSNSKHLQFHIMLLHLEKKEFPCLICTSRDQGSSSNPGTNAELNSQNFIFKDEYSLEQHMQVIHYTTHKQDTFQEHEHKLISFPKNKMCPICSKSFDGKWAASNYRGHMQTHLGIKKYSCEHCSKKFTTKVSLHMHLIRYHNYTSVQLNLKYTCQLCPFITLTQSKLSYHMSRKHPYAQLQLGDQINTDPQTAEPSLSHGNSWSTSSTKNPPQSAMCFVCSKYQTSKSNLVHHLKEHRGEGRFFCDHCPRDYSLRMSLLNHLRMDHHKLAYCNKCFTSFADVAALYQHRLDVDVPTSNSNQTTESQASDNADPPASNLKCEICDESSKSICLFRIHTISHLKEIQQQELNFPDDEVVSADNIFKCSVCPKVFDRQSYLNAHLKIVHETSQESSRFQCDKCERNYKFVSELKYHDLLTHSQKINQQVNRNHSAAPDGEFDFKCDICLTKFSTESELTSHQDNFRSEMICHICAAKFKGNTALVYHLKRVHKADNYSHEHLCHICPSTFIIGKELRRHVEQVHEGKYKKRRWYEYESAEKSIDIDHQSETLRDCNNSNNKVSDVLLRKKAETKAKLIPKPSRRRNKNKAKITTKSVMCFVCSEMQSNKGNLMIHLKEHRGEQRAYCDLCPRDFCARTYLMTHLKLDHHKLAYCNKCFTSYADNEALNQHLLQVDVPTLNSNQTIEHEAPENADSPKSNLKCEICGESSKSPCLFKLHTISHLKEIQQQELNFSDDEVVSVDNIFKCSVCPSAFDRQSYLDAHLNIVHENPPFRCGKCERTYKAQNELKSHDLVVHCPKINKHMNQNRTSEISSAELAFECSKCSSKFLTQSELTNHQDIFESMLPCHVCSTKFKCSISLKTHIRRVHGRKRKDLVCGFCPSKFSGSYNLNRHVQRMHEGKNKKTN